MRRSGIKRTSWLARHAGVRPTRKPIRRSGPIRPKKRKPSEFQRVYGGRARVRWIASLPCLLCQALSPFIGSLSRSHNAHTETGGMGRKADARTIVPLCANHHRRYDEHQPPFLTPETREAMKRAAAIIEARWQELQSVRPPAPEHGG